MSGTTDMQVRVYHDDLETGRALNQRVVEKVRAFAEDLRAIPGVQIVKVETMTVEKVFER